MVRCDAFVGIEDVNDPVLQPLGAVHRHEGNSLRPLLPGSGLKLQFSGILLHMGEPCLHRLKSRGTLRQLVQNLEQLLRLHTAVLGVLSDVIVISHRFAYVIHRGGRRQLPQEFQIVFQLFDPLHHPAFVLIKGLDRLPAHHRQFQCVPADVPVRAVNHRENAGAA